MKKIFTILFAAVLAANVWADEMPQLNFVQAQENPDGVVTFAWQGDSTLSKYYYLSLLYIDTIAGSQYSFKPVAVIMSSAKSFSTKYEGIFAMSTQLMCQYGSTYPKVKDNTELTPEQKADFQAGWAHVNEADNTLQAGNYYITVTGYGADMKTMTEKMGYAVLDVKGSNPSQGIENIFESKKPVKFMENGQVRILRDGKVYDMSGTLVR